MSNRIVDWILSLSPEEQKNLVMKMRDDYELFATVVMGHIVKDVPDYHKQMYKAFSKRLKRQAFLIFRGGGKSSISKTIQVTHDVCYGTEGFVLLISETREQASKDLVSIQDELENNEVIQLLFFPKGYVKGDVWNTEAFEAANGVYVYTAGYGSRVRGLKWKTMRPTKIILDDYESEDNTATDKQRDKVKKWVASVIKYAGVPDQTVFQFFGTIVHRDSHLAGLKNMSMFKGKDGIYLEVPVETNGQPAWPKRFTMAYIDEMRRDAEENRQIKAYMQEMYHIPSDIGKPRFNTEMIRELKAEYRVVGNVRYLVKDDKKIPLNVFMGIDPAKSITETADDSIFTTIGRTPTDDIVILDIYQDKIPPTEQLRVFAKLRSRLNPNVVTIEDNGGYGAIIPFIKEEIRARRIKSLTIMTFTAGVSKSKKWLLGLEIPVNSGNIYYVSSCKDKIETMKKQMISFNEDEREHDDMIDGLFLSIQHNFKPANYDVDARIKDQKKLDKTIKKDIKWNLI